MAGRNKQGGGLPVSAWTRRRALGLFRPLARWRRKPLRPGHFKGALALAALLSGQAFATEAPPRLAAGPMPGHSGMRTVHIWLQADGAADATLEYWPAATPGNTRSTDPVTLSRANQYSATIRVVGLQPGTRYRYRVRLNDRRVGPEQPLTFATRALWQWRTKPPDFRLATGSCAYINDPSLDRPGRPYGDGFEIFRTIADQKPDMMLWLGDHVYFRAADLTDPWGMAERYRQARAFPALQALLRATHHYAIWDDHDYGPNNANRSFVFKDQSLALFRRYWANPSYGLAQTPGTFTHFRFADVAFFLLDDRYYRNSDRAPDTPDKAMLGDQQIAWLKDALLHSRATFKIVASGSQLLNDHNRYEGWNHFPHERGPFLQWLREASIDGVVLLSGDRHHTELLRRDRPGTYPLYELTCSPLTSGTHDVADEAANPALVEGTLVGRRNFCRLDFTGARGGRRLTIRVFDTQGRALWKRELRARALRQQ